MQDAGSCNMKVNKRQLRRIIREEKRRILNESCPAADVPCPHATADALMSSGMPAGEILSWVSMLINDLTQAEVSPPTMASLPAAALDTGSPVSMESRLRGNRTQSRSDIRGVMPGYGFRRF